MLPTSLFYSVEAKACCKCGDDKWLWECMQTEIFDDGDFEYRYDLSRISDMDALTNVIIGAKFGTNELGDV